VPETGNQVTRERPPPPVLPAGAVLTFGEGLSARIERVSPLSSRLIELRFAVGGGALYTALYREGDRSSTGTWTRKLDVLHIQTTYGGRPGPSRCLPRDGRSRLHCSPLSGERG